MTRRLKIAPNRHATHPFDQRYGTDTGGYLSPEDLRSGEVQDSIHDSTNNGYSAVAPSVFREACRRWRETLASASVRVGAYTFVDVGAGKGRALLLASEMPFRKVIGIECSEVLARIAGLNLVQWNQGGRRSSKIRILRQDASEFQWPRPPLLVYLNNPFDCILVERMAEKLAAAAASGRSLVDVIYVNPGCAEILTRRGIFKKIWDTEIQMDEPDRHADPYGAISDRVAAFQITKAQSTPE